MRDHNHQAVKLALRRLVAVFAFVIAGAGLATSAAAPAGATTLAPATQIVSGTNSFCALLTTGGVDCWGYNSFGQLGNGNTTNSPTPEPVLGVGGIGTLSGVARLVQSGSGSNTFCAILTDTRLVCWGSNRDGVLGSGSTANQSTTPMVVKGVGGTGELTGVADVALGEMTACARLTSGNVVCWGSNNNGDLGIGTYSAPAPCSNNTCSTPVAAVGIGGTGVLTGITKLVTWHGERFCVVAGGGVACWGYLWSGTPTAVPAVGGIGTLSGVDDVVIGGATCAHLTSGGVACWGTNPDGNLGNGTTSLLAVTTIPTMVVGVGGTGTLSNVTQIAGALGSTCALLTSTGVVCWGSNAGGTYYGALGAGTNFAPVDSLHCYGHCTPTPVNTVGATGTGTQSGVTGLVTYGYGYGYCATLSNGGVNCWGDGPLGRTSATPFAPSVPEPVAGIGGTGTLGGVQTVAGDWPAYDGAGAVNCALLQLGRVVCWGSNHLDDLGNAGISTFSATPVGVDGFFDTTAPTVKTSTPTSLVTLSTTVPVAWSASDNVGVDHVSVRTRVAAWNGNLGGYSTWQANTNATHANYAGTTGRTYCFSARAYDTSANASAWTADRCTSVPLRADQLSRSSAWTRNNNTAEFAGFDYRSKTKNTTLTRPGIYAKKVWLVVTKCSSCGTVQVRWNGATIATVNTYNATTVHKQVVNVANWTTTHTGTLTATVTSATGRVVAVEGLAMFNG